jgi:hypothetical protein
MEITTEDKAIELSIAKPKKEATPPSLANAPQEVVAIYLAQREEVKKFLDSGKEKLSDHKKSDFEKLMDELDREDRRDLAAPSKEEVAMMDEDLLEITTRNTLYQFLNFGLNMDERLKKMEGDRGKFVYDLMNSLWNSRMYPDSVSLIDQAGLEAARQRVTELEKPWDKEKRYQQVLEKSYGKAKLIEREKNELSQLGIERTRYQYSKEFLNKKTELEELGDYLEGEKNQKAWQESIALELRHMSGAEFGALFGDVLFKSVLVNRYKMRWNGAEEAYVEMDESVNKWFDDHADSEAVEKPLEVSDPVKADNLKALFMNRIRASETFWGDWDGSQKLSFTRELEVLLKKLEGYVIGNL